MGDTGTPLMPLNTPPEQSGVPQDFTQQITPPQYAPDNVNVTTPQPTPQGIDPSVIAQAQQLLASVPTPDYNPGPIDIQKHMNGIRGVLQDVSSFLAGPTEYKAIVQPDGSMSISQQPSTEKEKWARIAAAVVGGAARGMAVGQGPGGAGRAIGAGYQTGLQIPQQQTAAAQNQVNQNNKELLDRANRIHLQQQAYLGQQQIAMGNLNLGKANEDALNRYLSMIQSSPNAVDMGPIDPKDPNAVIRLAKQNPDAMDAFLGKTNMVLQMAPAADGKLHLIMTDRAWADQKNTEPMEIFGTRKGDDNMPEMTSQTVGPGKVVVQQALNNNLAVATKVANARKDLSAANRTPPSKLPTTVDAALAAASAATDPAEKTRLTNLANQMQAMGISRAAAGRASASAPPPAAELQSWVDTLTDPSTGATLASVPIKQRGAVLAEISRQGRQLTHPLTGKELDRADLANNAIQNVEKAQQILQNRPDLFGPRAYWEQRGLRAIGRGDPDLADFRSAINLANLPAVGVHGVRGRYAIEDLKNLDANIYQNPQEMERILNNIHTSATDFAKGGGRQAAPPPAAPAAAPAAPAAAAPRAAAPAPRPFDATKWAAANPGKNVQQAIDQARRQGLNVLNIPQGAR